MAPGDRAALVQNQRGKLRALIECALPANRFLASKLAGCEIDQFHEWPFTTKAELVADQTEHPPFGTVLTFPRERYTRLHQTSGTTTGRPLRWLDTPESWTWMLDCWRQKFALMGVRPTDRFCFAFSYGPFIGFWTGHEAAIRNGSFVLTLGGMSSAARLRAIIENDITVVGCTPTYALHLSDVAAAERLGLPGSSVRMVIVAGEPGGCIPATRSLIETGWGARVIDHCGMTETGPMGVECEANPGGMHLLESELIAEVIDPATMKPAPPGTTGELVVTNLGRIGSPVIRYRTGDVVRIDPKPCPCGSPYVRLDGGILGRTDDMIHVRGNNLYPSAIEAVLRSIGGVAEYRVEIDRRGPLPELRIEVEPANGVTGQALADRVGRAVRDQLLLRAEITVAEAGSLPRFEMKSKRISHK